MRKLAYSLNKVGCILTCYVFPIAATYASIQILREFQFADAIFLLLSIPVIVVALITSFICSVVAFVWVMIGEPKRPIYALGILALQILGVFIGSLAGALLIYFTAPTTLSSIDETMTPEYQLKCEQDSHHCMGDGFLVLAVLIVPGFTAIPGAVIGAYRMPRIARWLWHKVRGYRRLS